MQPNAQQNHKSLIFIGLIVLALIIAGYFYFTRDRSSETDLLASAPVTAIIDKDLLSTLKELESIKLDEKVFSDRIFLSLTDFGRALVPQPSGRQNPFAPFSQDELRVGSLSTSSIAVPSLSSTSR